MNRRAYNLFAEILEYPGTGLIERVKECASLLEETNQEASTRLQRFLAIAQALPASRLEEIYTSTFDLQPCCYPYVGYQVLGDSYSRGAFMVALKQRYRACGLPEGNELPDHLTLVLRFLAVTGDAEREEFALLCLIPALDKMAQGFRNKENPYREVIGALLLFIQREYPKGKQTAAS